MRTLHKVFCRTVVSPSHQKHQKPDSVFLLKNPSVRTREQRASLLVNPWPYPYICMHLPIPYNVNHLPNPLVTVSPSPLRMYQSAVVMSKTPIRPTPHLTYQFLIPDTLSLISDTLSLIPEPLSTIPDTLSLISNTLSLIPLPMGLRH
jgi:hypothetical protein